MKNSFSINTIFLVLTIIGLGLVPFLSIQLNPTIESNYITVSYRWPGISSEIVEKEVTSVLEGVLSSVKGLKRIESHSGKGYGQIQLQFKKGTDMDAVRFEVGSLMRHVYSRLPEQVSRPQVSYNSGNNSDRKLLMTYTLNGEGSSLSLQQYANDHIVPVIGALDMVDRVAAEGAIPLEWELAYDPDKLQNINISVNDIKKAIGEHRFHDELGRARFVSNSDTSYLFLSFYGQPGDSLNWNKIIVTNRAGRLIRLTDIVKPRLKEQKPRSYFRINGLNTIYLNIYTAKGANQIKTAEKIIQAIEKLKPGFPRNFSLILNYNASKRLREETSKILYRSGLAIVILLLFVLLISRQWRYLAVIGTSLLANLAIAIIFYYWLGIDIHLYSLAGITVSLGIIIDNTIIMADHIRYHSNNKVFIAILAATLTTMGALSVIFFLNEYQRNNLVDFALVMIINLGVSLFIALFFIPSLMDKIPLKVKRGGRVLRRKKRVVKFTRMYERFICFGHRFRWAFIVLAIWGFGIPFFMLPDRLGDEKKNDEELKVYERWYNKTLGNSTFVSEVKPWVNKILGGSLYYFTSYMAEQNFNWDNQQTKLYVRISMPNGATLEQMNKVFLDVENYLASFKEIDRFITSITGIDGSTITIHFKKEYENTSFPYYLKQLLITRATQTGGADTQVWGVGRGFNNSLNTDSYNSTTIKLKGYNFDELMRHARYLKKEVLKLGRVKKAFIITDGRVYGNKPRYEFIADVNSEKLAYSGTSIRYLFNRLSQMTQSETNAGSIPLDKAFIPIVLRPGNRNNARIWEMKNFPVKGRQGEALRFDDVAKITKERVDGTIYKANQQYSVSVTYDYIGNYQLASKVLKQNIEKMNKYLPLGFTAENGRGTWYWRQDEKQQYWLLFLVIAIIYFICAILLESLLQPLAVIATIPLSFIGVFLTFAMFKFKFDQGGYASMVLLSGLTVNSALYIINDFNNNIRSGKGRNKLRKYLKAYNHKIIPILLTILSTSLGLVPFIIGGQDEGFWFSLAVGTIGGLMFSLLAIVVWLPLFFKLSQRTQRINNKKVQ